IPSLNRRSRSAPSPSTTTVTSPPGELACARTAVIRSPRSRILSSCLRTLSSSSSIALIAAPASHRPHPALRFLLVLLLLGELARGDLLRSRQPRQRQRLRAQSGGGQFGPPLQPGPIRRPPAQPQDVGGQLGRITAQLVGLDGQRGRQALLGGDDRDRAAAGCGCRHGSSPLILDSSD